MLRPRHVLLSGVSAGLVVAGVIGFEALSGIQPGYEMHHQTLHGCLHWTILLLPSLAAAVLGGEIGRRFDCDAIAR